MCVCACVRACARQVGIEWSCVLEIPAMLQTGTITDLNACITHI